jgi:hypothetical protein
LDNHKITARLDELRSPVIEASKLTLEKHLAALEELRDEARGLRQMAAAISAEVSRGKAAGLYVVRQEITGKNGEALAVKDEYNLSLLSDDEFTLFVWLSMKARGFDESDPEKQNLRREAQALVKFDT